ncbi:MAG: TauD/TfdA family dioxygenase [Acidobacteria bacterium]|nr:TauD/TfdA family dioxygenase [Acidobacteriota bacterium]MCA1638170.1 TauD/TfdA family dioxygenase [Acidobacteriota bacterium]
MKTSFINQQKLPLVVEAGDNAQQDFSLESLVLTCVNHRDFLQNKLLEYGALLFRGFSVQTSADFEKVVRAFSNKNLLNYAGGVSPRVELGGGVYTSTEYPAQYVLSLHNELSYSHQFPSHLYFCCLQPWKVVFVERRMAARRRYFIVGDHISEREFKKAIQARLDVKAECERQMINVVFGNGLDAVFHHVIIRSRSIYKKLHQHRGLVNGIRDIPVSK